MCFVDLEKAFDRVPHGILWEVRGPLLRAVRSLYNRSRSLVHIASCKSDLFPVHVGLRQGCPLSLVLFIVFMDRISRRSQGLEGVRFGDHRISSLIFADDVVLLASSGLDLQHALGHFAAECEAAGMRVSTSKSETMVLDRKKVACTLQVGGEVLPQVEEFKYLGVLFTSEGRMNREIDRRISALAAVMRSMYRSVVVKKELSRKAKFSIYQSIYVPTLTYGHELWVMTERTSSAAEEPVFRVEKALEKLQDKMDHTLVHVVVWGGRVDGRTCECEEGVSADTRTWHRLERAAIVANIQDSLGALLQKHHQWTEGENFTVALQSSPTFFDSSDDSEEERDSQTLRQLWSKLLQPMAPEVEVEGRGIAVSCPSQRNSAVQPENKTYSADIQTTPMATRFPCTVTSPSPSVPTSVHFLRPADVKVVAALGDSLTAGNGVGAGQNNVLGVITEYRGLSWRCHDEEIISLHLALLNILREFNPSLTGFSTGTGKATTAQAFLNQAVAGAESKDLPSQTRALITRMTSDSSIDFQNDWKVITLFIGGNDLCEHCANLDFYSSENFARNIRDALDILHQEVPRVLVNLVELFDITQLRQLHLDFKLGCPTWLVKSICPCVLNPAEGSPDLQALIDLNREYQTVTRNLVDSGRYNTRFDFTVVLQPFFRNVSFPLLTDGRPDRSFFAGDCFHLSQKSHTLMARALWNNMLEPLNSKTTSMDFNEGVAMKCPSESNPYFSTNKNSALDFVATPMIANWGSDFSCTHTTPSDAVPASVHRLRPGDIKIVAALGDSITAGFGAKAKNLLQLPNEERGVSWSIGGDETLETVTTLPNILKKFNPNVFGFSRGRSKRPNGFNMAVSGAKAINIPGQVRDLVKALKNSTSVDFEQDWKLVTLFIGGNDLCQYCQNPASLSPKKYIGYIKEAMDILYHEVPRVLVNFVELLQIENLRKIKTLCPCFLRPEENSAELFEMKRINRQMQTETERLVFGGRYESREDFALVLQPFFQSTVVPMGEPQYTPMFMCFFAT
ncbi:hypothetical protein QTP86_027793 [Hemibagrus guttatus]|nr:hypothetical protein QTP86_027793 [Hemibagrus guttatus]